MSFIILRLRKRPNPLRTKCFAGFSLGLGLIKTTWANYNPDLSNRVLWGKPLSFSLSGLPPALKSESSLQLRSLARSIHYCLKCQRSQLRHNVNQLRRRLISAVMPNCWNNEILMSEYHRRCWDTFSQERRGVSSKQAGWMRKFIFWPHDSKFTSSLIFFYIPVGF